MFEKNIGNKNVRWVGHTFDPSRGHPDGSGVLYGAFLVHFVRGPSLGLEVGGGFGLENIMDKK